MKPGPKPKSPNGLPKRHYGTNLALDVIAVIREQPNQAEFLERIVRGSEEFRDYQVDTGVLCADGVCRYGHCVCDHAEENTQPNCSECDCSGFEAAL